MPGLNSVGTVSQRGQDWKLRGGPREGDDVATDFSGRVTRHRVVALSTGVSQTGVLVQVEPPVPGAGSGWQDRNWFWALAEPQADLF